QRERWNERLRRGMRYTARHTRRLRYKTHCPLHGKAMKVLCACVSSECVWCVCGVCGVSRDCVCGVCGVCGVSRDCVCVVCVVCRETVCVWGDRKSAGAGRGG